MLLFPSFTILVVYFVLFWVLTKLVFTDEDSDVEAYVDNKVDDTVDA